MSQTYADSPATPGAVRGAAPYTVILVEDEVVAREGIRDTLDWAACGFAFAGEASDGEAALPLIERVVPNVLITDIRMPFMDGLQLTREVHRRFPSIHVLILSGYDDFAYAQMAIHLGVVEYLLKPVSARDLERALVRMKALLDEEQARVRDQNALRVQASAALELQREDTLLRICLGDVDADELFELAPQVGLSLDAPCWQVLVARIASATHAEPRRLQEMQAQLLESGDGPGVCLFRKDIEEVVALLYGERDEVAAQAEQIGARFAALLPPEGALWLEMGQGDLRREWSELPFSFAAALEDLNRTHTLDAGAPEEGSDDQAATSPWQAGAPATGAPDASAVAWPVDRRALDRFLRHGTLSDFESFYASCVRATQTPARTAPSTMRPTTWLLLDVTLAAASFVAEMGGDVTHVVPEAARMDALWSDVQNDDDLRALVLSIVERTLAYRDRIARSSHAHLVRDARAAIERDFADPGLSLQRVAAGAHLSPSHFSVVFGRETGETFKGYLTRVRMERARELLRTTPLPVTEVARRCGYPDPHYFSSAFKRVCGVSPRDFRDAGPG